MSACVISAIMHGVLPAAEDARSDDRRLLLVIEHEDPVPVEVVAALQADRLRELQAFTDAERLAEVGVIDDPKTKAAVAEESRSAEEPAEQSARQPTRKLVAERDRLRQELEQLRAEIGELQKRQQELLRERYRLQRRVNSAEATVADQARALERLQRGER